MQLRITSAQQKIDQCWVLNWWNNLSVNKECQFSEHSIFFLQKIRETALLNSMIYNQTHSRYGKCTCRYILHLTKIWPFQINTRCTELHILYDSIRFVKWTTENVVFFILKSHTLIVLNITYSFPIILFVAIHHNSKDYAEV